MGIAISRKVLLIEIERHCRAPRCSGKVRLGLTQEEAGNYRGFECDRCKEWIEDILTERDIPDWWHKLASARENKISA